MEFLRVSDGKLKIMLNTLEMQKYGLDAPELDYSDKSVRSAFWKILDEAKIKADFDTGAEKLLIQFYPASFGGEIFVTKLGALSKSAERSIGESDRIAMLTEEKKIYMFDSLSDLARAVCVNFDVLSGGTEAYLSEDGNFYLLTEERNLRPASSFTEFGTELPKSLASYIKERARSIENPIENLMALSAKK